MKSIVFVALALAVIAGCYGQSHHQFWGTVGWNGTLVYSNKIVKTSQMLQTVEVDITYPPAGVINYRPITAVRAYDLKTNGNGATASILRGGLNNTTITVRFKSIRGHGINFNLEIYARN